MADDLTKFSPEDMRNKIVDMVRQRYIELLPQAALLKLVKDCEYEFLHDELPKLVRAAFVERTKKDIAEYLASEGFQKQWGAANLQEPGVLVQEMVRQLTPDLMQAHYAGMIEAAVQEVRQRMMNSGHSGNW